MLSIRRPSIRCLGLSQRRLYSSVKNKKSTLTPEDEQADFANRNEKLFTANSGYPLLGQVTPRNIPIYRIRQVWDKYTNIKHTREPEASPITVRGRINSIRKSGKGLIFLDVTQDLEKLQIVINKNRLGYDNEKFIQEHSIFRRGDHVSATGFPWRTKSGELSILADRTLQLLTPCLHPLPTNLKDAVTRNHNRVVDLAVNKEAQKVILTRSAIIGYIRGFLQQRDFLEVQTPMISSHVGGAAAEPFLTSSRALDSNNTNTDLALRISPELWLKRLVISGFDKVFELGQCFRNEGIDSTHNPEFTTCEFYQSHTTLEELIELTESMLRGVVQHVPSEITTGLFDEFKQIDFIDGIQSKTGVPLPENLNNRTAILEYYRKIGITPNTTDDDHDIPKLLDGLSEIYIEPECYNRPTFIINHPSIMAPLAKSTVLVDSYGIERPISRRFELFIEGKEYVNAYEEENSPFIQRENFQKQSGEAEISDEGFVKALEWGLPPTGGWGMGIDRLVMLLTGSTKIDQVLAFGSVKTVNYQ